MGPRGLPARLLRLCFPTCCGDGSPPGALPSPRRAPQAIDAAQGMLYLHHRGVVHRDLKGPNLLIDQGWHVKARVGGQQKGLLH